MPETKAAASAYPPFAHILLACILLLLSAQITHAMSDQDYINTFIAYFIDENQVITPTPTLEQYATPAKYDSRVNAGFVNIWVGRINDNQNSGNAPMGWTSSTAMTSLNDMYKTTGDTKYLTYNLALARASIANTDDKVLEHPVWWDPCYYAPGWGTDYYAGRWNIHPVHTGTIIYGIAEFLELAPLESSVMAQFDPCEYDYLVAETLEALDWHDRQWVSGPGFDEAHYISKDNEIGNEGNVLVANRLSAMGLALWSSWRATGNTIYRDKALKLARYMKHRLRIYSDGAYWWPGALPYTAINDEPVQYLHNPSGPGSDFPNPITLTAASNSHAAYFTGGFFTQTDDPAFTLSQFTIEACVNKETTGLRYIFAQHYPATNNRSWALYVDSDQTLKALLSEDGSSDTTINSGLSLTIGQDYYVAMSFDQSTQTNGVTFYLKNLTAGTPLQTALRDHTITSLHDATANVYIGSTSSRTNNWIGLIDEVRLSDTVLPESQLLISAGTPSSSTVGYWRFEVTPGILADSSANNLDFIATSSGTPPSASSKPTEDFSHGSLTVCFPLTLGLEDQLFHPDDMAAFGKTITNGFARLDNGVIFGRVNGTAQNNDWQIVRSGMGYYLRVAPYAPDAHRRMCDFMRTYQGNYPYYTDIASMVRFSQATPKAIAPNVIGLTQANAELAIIAAQLTVGTVYNTNSITVPAGCVISQQYTPDSWLAIDTPMDLTISLGPTAGDFNLDNAIDVADLTIMNDSWLQCCDPTNSSCDPAWVAAGEIPVDVDGDCYVSLSDFGILGKLWLDNAAGLQHLVGWWQFDEATGSNAQDSSLINNGPATITNATWTTRYDGAALLFDGSDYVTIPTETFDTISDQISIAFWANGDAAQPQDDYLFEAHNTNGRVLACMLPWGDKKIYWQAGNDSSGNYDSTEKLTYLPYKFEGQWTHWLLTKNASTGYMTIYRNGILWHRQSGHTKFISAITSFKLGADVNGNNNYAGSIDDFRVYDSELSAEDALKIACQSSNCTTNDPIGWWDFDDAAGSTATDSSIYANNGTITGAAWVPGHSGSALDFNGTDYVTIPSAALAGLSDEVTITFWQFGDSIQPQDDYLFEANNSYGRVLGCHLPWSDGSVYFDAGNTSNGAYDRIENSILSTPQNYNNQWNHWALTKNANTGVMRIYINGLPWYWYGYFYEKPMNNITSFKIGSSVNGTRNYDGVIDDFRVYDRELTETEIMTIYKE